MSKAIAVFFAALLFTCNVYAQDSLKSGQQITLRQAISIALKNNYQVKVANNNIQGAEDAYKRAEASFLPSISGGASFNHAIGQQFNNVTVKYQNQSISNASGDIGASIPIFQGLRNIYSLRRASSNKRSLQEQARQTKEDIIFTTANDYLNLLLDKQLLHIANENLLSSQKQLAQIKAQVQVGSSPISDQYTQEATVASNEYLRTQRENTVNVDRIKLISQLQLNPLSTYHFVTPALDTAAIKVRHYNINQLVDDALMNRADIKSQESTIKSDYFSLKVAKSQLYPSLSLRGSISSSYNNKFENPLTRTVYPFGKQFFNLNVNKAFGLSLSIPIFSGLSAKYNVQSSMINYENAKLNLESLKLSVVQSLETAYSDYLNYSQQLKSTQAAVIAAKKAYETQQERYKVGAGTLLELTQADASYVTASSNRAQALYQFIFQEQLLNYFIGKINPDMQIEALKF